MRRTWTPREVKQLLENYGAVPTRTLAYELERSTVSVRQKARRLYMNSHDCRTLASTYRARCSSTVNARFFEQADQRTILGLGFIFSCGRLKTKHRQVLKVSVDESHLPGLHWFLALMESNHTVQKHRRRWFAEIGNSYLVHSLTKRWGVLSSTTFPDPPLPAISPRDLRAFSVGYLRGAGVLSNHVIRWTGTPSITRAIGEFLSRHLRISAPRHVASGGVLHVVWTNPGDIREITDFLESEMALTHPCQSQSQ